MIAQSCSLPAGTIIPLPVFCRSVPQKEMKFTPYVQQGIYFPVKEESKCFDRMCAASDVWSINIV